MIRIRYTDDHDDEILALDALLFPDPVLDDPLRIEPSAECWAAFDRDVLVGYAVAYLEPDGTHYLDRYGVAPEYAGHGLGRRLLRRWVTEARDAGAPCAWTYTHSHNAASINALTGAGFRAWAPGIYPRTGAPASERHCLWRRVL